VRIAVIGAGPSGLVAAWELLARARAAALEAEIVVFEAAKRPGGNVWTDEAGGYRIEHGPEGFLDSAPRTLALAAQLGLAGRLVGASPAAEARFIYADGRLHRVPSTPLALLVSGLLSVPARLRVLAEPFQPRGTAHDESVWAFAARRLGPEAADRLIGAMVAGVYAGDPASLSMPAAFPQLFALEREYGSLTRALVARRRRAKRQPAPGSKHPNTGGPTGPAGRLTSFAGGLRELIEALAQALGDRLHLETPVRDLRRAGSRWRVSAGSAEVDCDRIIITTPPWHAADLTSSVDLDLAQALAAIPPAPVTAVALGFRAADLSGINLEGFGFLAPAGQGLRILGCLWSSSIFPNRAPEGRILLRVLVGGARDPEAASYDDDQLMDVVRADLSRAMGLDAEPELIRIYRFPRAIPQYTLGHLDRLRTIQQRLARLPGLYLHGSGYRGISLNDCIRLAPEVATAALGTGAASPAPLPS
jgi:oxygen-dependent protoporphyrinogen oxidase